MARFLILFKKELLDARRSYKLLWLPIVFIILGLTQPLTTYFLPNILQALGGLPDGIEFNLPEFTGQEVLASTLSEQFDQLGLLIVIIAMMNSVISDKSSGMLSFILTRQTTLTEYLVSKWLAQSAIIITSVILGFVAAAYYSVFLFNGFSGADALISLVIYLVWCLFIFTVTMTFSAIFNKPAAAAALSFILLIFLKLLTVLKAEVQIFNPASLSNQAAQMLMEGETLPYFFGTLTTTIVLIVALIVMTRQLLTKKELYSM